MKQITNFLTTPAGQISVIVAVAAIGVYLAEKKARQVANAVNPNSKDNLVYGGVNAVGETLTGRENFDLGVWLYDITHGGGN